MLSTTNIADVLHIVMISIGVILLLKKIAEMEKYYYARLFALTFVLSLVAVLFFIGYGLNFVDEVQSDCLENHFCLTEM